MEQILYGPPPSVQQPLYGIPYTETTLVSSIFSFLFSSTFVISGFVIGSVLYLITHKKIFIIIPLIIGSFYFAIKLLGIILGISL